MKKTITCICFICSISCTQAQTFAEFETNFPVESENKFPLPYDEKMLSDYKKNAAKLKQIPFNLLQKFVIWQLYNREGYPIEEVLNRTSALFPNLFGFSTFEDFEKNIAAKKINFYYVKKTNIFPNFKTFLIYLSDEVQLASGGVGEWLVIALNYSKENKLISAYNLINSSSYMSYRVYVSEIDTNWVLKHTELDYQPLEKGGFADTTLYKIDRYYQIDPNTTEVTDIQAKLFPFSGTFVCDNHKIIIDQNTQYFYILQDNSGGKYQTGCIVKEYDLTKRTFSFQLDEDEKNIWKARMNEDFNTIQIARPDNSIAMYKREQ